MIIIAGKWKGHKLKTPKGSQTRPTTSLLRKALFDICKNYIDETRFLDLFAGSGAMGFEALSRGAAHITFVEQDREALSTLSENMRLLDCASQIKIERGNALTLIKKFSQGYDIIYIDPPYGKIVLSELLFLIDERRLLRPEGVLFVETRAPAQEALETLSFEQMYFEKVRRFGGSLLYQFRHFDL